MKRSRNLDQEHLVHAKHPIIDRTREYFAFQVDQHAAQFDNVQILTATAKKTAEGRAKMNAAAGKFPVKKAPEEQFDIRKTNAHESFYQNDETYRALVTRVDEMDKQRKQRFPDAFRSHKDYKKAIQNERKQLTQTDPAYKEALHATHRAKRAIDDWLIAQHPELDALPSNRKKAAIAQLHRKSPDAPELRKLVEQVKAGSEKTGSRLPQALRQR